MTREKLYHEVIFSDRCYERRVALNNYFEENDTYITSLEARIAELECARNLSIIRIKELEAPKNCDSCKYLDITNESEYGTFRCINPIGGMTKWQSLKSYCNDFKPKDGK